jgi:hypothetical protein
VAASVVAAAALLPACSGDDAPPAPSSAAPATTEAGATPTTTPRLCTQLADRYLDTFFALGAGTPRDPEATTVRLPVQALLAIDAEAEAAGCADFTDVACSAYAELEAQGLEAVNSEPPDRCPPG